MYFQYGTYVHPLGEPAVTIAKETIYSDALRQYAVRERWDVAGLITGASTAAAMDAKVAELIAAYASDGGDMAILLPDGSLSSHVILSRNTIGGTRVVQPPSFPDGGGAQGVTIRSFTVAIEAIYPTVPVNSILTMAFEESLSFSGGGPRYGHLETLTGWPVKQQLRAATIYRAHQTGRSVGLWTWPTVPAAIWPAALVRSPDIQRRSPRRRGNTYTEYEVAWAYQFEAAIPLIGTPHAWTL